ncbi:unnamed protein product [Closterium sp. NIES-65]|nr:unnamed protein product [Closterium sp. NIES-65]
MEGKIAARKDKEKAAEEAISSVSGKSAAGPKPKQGRMEDFYGDEGLSSKRNSDEVICLYFAGMRVAEWQCENLLFLNMLRAVATVPNYVPPKRDYTGVTIASDMMTDKSGRAPINILLLNDAGAVFIEAVDCKMELKSEAFVADILRPIIKKIGPENAVSAVHGRWQQPRVGMQVAAGGVTAHRACAMRHPRARLADGGHRQDGVDARRRRPSGRHDHVSAYPPVDARFSAESGAARREGAAAAATGGHAFWDALMEVPFMVMRRTDSQAKGMMGAIYDIMLQLTEDMAKLLDGDMCKLKEEEKEEVQEHLRRRWDESLACPLHVVGRILNSANQLEEIFLRDVECTKVMREWLARSKVFVDKFWKGKKGPHKSLQEGMLAYINATGSFGSEEARLGREELQDGKGDVLAWWQYHGWEYADLAGLARRALSQPVSAAPCERNWSVWDGVHTARRNRLGSEKVRDLVYVALNWTVVHNHHKGAAVAGPSGVGRKGGIVEGNIPTPPLPEGYKLEEDGEVEEDEDAMCVDEHAHQEDGEEEEEGGEDED